MPTLSGGIRKMRIVRKFADPKANTIYVEKTLTDAARAFGITANALGYKPNIDKEGEDVMLVSIFGNKLLPAEVFESYGTIRFINEFPLVILALLTGGTLVMDEFDASIHPMTLMNIINIFHNDEVNRNGAQLIFNTHNPIFLDATLLRRDEIKFVERDETTGNSIHYALSDFKTADGILKPHQQPEQHDAGKGVQFGQAETGPASVESDFNILGNLAHKILRYF